MLNDSRALLRQTGTSSFRMTLDFIEGEVLDGLIPALNRCKEQGVLDEGVCFECNNGVNLAENLALQTWGNRSERLRGEPSDTGTDTFRIHTGIDPE